jgi:hypothetical protein
MLRPEEDCFDRGTAPVRLTRENLRAAIVDDICAQSRDASPTFPVYVVMRNEPSISTHDRWEHAIIVLRRNM